MGFTAEVLAELSKPLDASRVAHRSNRGGSLSYLQGYDVIDTLNTIFGYDGWDLDVKDVRQFGPIVQATVTVIVSGPGYSVGRTDVGAAIPAGDSNEALETAIKAAVTDGMKRAARTFGNQFGNSLYEKDSPLHTNGNAARTIPGQAPNFTRPTGNTPPVGTAPSPGGVRTISAAQVGFIGRLGGTDADAMARFGVANLAAIPAGQAASAWIDELKADGFKPASNAAPRGVTRTSAPAVDADVPF